MIKLVSAATYLLLAVSTAFSGEFLAPPSYVEITPSALKRSKDIELIKAQCEISIVTLRGTINSLVKATHSNKEILKLLTQFSKSVSNLKNISEENLLEEFNELTLPHTTSAQRFGVGVLAGKTPGEFDSAEFRHLTNNIFMGFTGFVSLISLKANNNQDISQIILPSVKSFRQTLIALSAFIGPTATANRFESLLAKFNQTETQTVEKPEETIQTSL